MAYHFFWFACCSVFFWGSAIVSSVADEPIRPPIKAAPPLHSRPPDSTSAHYDYWLSGDAADVHPTSMSGGLLLAGGGGSVMTAWEWFFDCAGHGDIVVLSASGSDVYQDLLFKRVGGANSVETINFKDAEAAHNAQVLEIIAKADGIFLTGGKQTRYIAWWKDSPVEQAINAHIRAGKPLGGSSAGLAIMGQYYYGSMNGSVTSKTALKDPYFKMVDVGGNFISAPLLDQVLTDTHFSNRQRTGRMLVFLSRLMKTENSPRLAGLGLDEGTALCIESSGLGKVRTEKNGSAWLFEPTQQPSELTEGNPLEIRHVKVTEIGPGSSLNILKREVTNPVSTRYVSALAGEVRDDP